jgi:outer membrane protein insertion porin family
LARRSPSRPCEASPRSCALFSPVRPGNAFPVILLLAVVCGFAATALSLPQEVNVRAISVRGNSRISSEAIINTSGLSVGQVYPYEEVRAGLRRVFEMGFFDDVRLYLEDVATGQELTIEVAERPVVGAIRISGTRALDKGDVREKVALGVGSSLDSNLVFKSLAAIKSLYKEKGFYLAEVSSRTEPLTENTVALEFVLDEGVKVKVGKINIEGNRSLSDKAIRKAMETKEKGWISRKDYNPEVFEQDLERIRSLYRDQGFWAAEVISHTVTVDQDRGLADLTVVVAEGPRTYIKAVDIQLEGDRESGETVSEAQLRAGVELEPGQAYSQSLSEKTLENLYSILGDQGFVYAQIEPLETMEEDGLNLTYRIDPRRAVKVHKIIIEGNHTTFDKVIRRELVIGPGEVLRRSLIERSHREVFNLGYFEDVQVGSQPANQEGDVDLVFTIKERQIGVANVGAGYSEEFGLTGFVEFSHNNIGWYRKFPYLGLGKGQSMDLRWEFGKLTQIELSYRDPWFRDQPTLVGFDIFDTKREYDTYTDKRDGFGLVFGRRIRFIDYSQAYLRYSLERRELDPDEATASDYVKSQAGKVTTSSTIVTFIRNSVDNPFFPRDGSRTALTAEWAGGWLGGTTAYQSYILESSDFMGVPLLNSALLFKVRMGVVDELGSNGYIPVYERFRLGGTTVDGIRGYSEREVVPQGNAIDEGGRFMMTGTIEYRVPVVKNRAHILGFMDAGNTWNSFRAARSGFLLRSAGLGFRIEIPMMGQLGLDIAYGFDREERFGGPGWKTHFQFGTVGY